MKNIEDRAPTVEELEDARRTVRAFWFSVRDELAKGTPAKDVAAMFGISPAYVSRIATEAGVGPRQVSRKRAEEVAADYRAGVPVLDIMKKYNISRRTVWTLVKRVGVPLRRGKYRDRTA
jgi:hypothetical protein